MTPPRSLPLVLSRREVLAGGTAALLGLSIPIPAMALSHMPASQALDPDTIGDTPFDVVVVGGGPAGLSAALTLGRARRRVLLCAHGPTRNAPAHAAHGVFTRDGTPPEDLVRIGREQLTPYDVTIRDAEVTAVASDPDGFDVQMADGAARARKVILATGLRDLLPDVPGFAELWGTGVFHCPFCHGWEVGGQPLAIYGRGARAVHLATLLRGWSDDLVLFTDGPAGLTSDERSQIAGRGVAVREEPVARLVGQDGQLEAVELEGGERVPRGGLFFGPEQELRSDLAVRLGCTLGDDGRVEADAFGRTSVADVYVAGDTSPAMQQVIAAAASGSAAGAGAAIDFLFGAPRG